MPSPIEVAAIAGTFTQDGQWRPAWEFQELIRPPDDVPITTHDTAQTGIPPAMLTAADPATKVMADLDARLTAPTTLAGRPRRDH